MNINGAVCGEGENCTAELRLFLQSAHVNGHGARRRGKIDCRNQRGSKEIAGRETC
jgi:hypothetical protein